MRPILLAFLPGFVIGFRERALDIVQIKPYLYHAAQIQNKRPNYSPSIIRSVQGDGHWAYTCIMQPHSAGMFQYTRYLQLRQTYT